MTHNHSFLSKKTQTMTHAKTDLLNIMQEPDLTKRVILMNDWWNSWILEIEQNQLVLDSRYLSSEFHDMLKTRLSEKMLEIITEDCVNYDVSTTNITSTLIAIRRRKKR